MRARGWLIFEGVTRATWDWLGEVNPNGAVEAVVDVIGFDPGEPDGRRPAIITTDLFELYLTYQQWRLVRD